MHHITELAAMSDHAEVEIIRQTGYIVGGILTLLGIIITAILNRTRQHAKETRRNTEVVVDQVKNDHVKNFRHEGDDRHAEIIEKLTEQGDLLASLAKTQDELAGSQKTLAAVQRSQAKSIGGIRDDIRQQRRDFENERSRIRELEDTRPIREHP